MRMSDDQYFRSCVAQERHLAQLLGYHNLEECYESAGTLWSDMRALPKWTREWSACGPLLTRFRLSVSFHDDANGPAVTVGPVIVHLADHPNHDRAVMMAVVKAAIHQLEHRAANPASQRDRSAHPA